jgi:hypothetical protein
MALKKSNALVAAAVSLALSSMLLATSLNAGVINNDNPTAGKLGACGATDADLTACVGAWDLDNVEVKLYHANGSVFGAFDEVSGVYTSMIAGDSFASLVSSPDGLVAKVTGKIWPVGEPSGIKVVTGDAAVKNGKPENCLINTAYLEGTFLDVAAPMPVICSSPFQSHKRFKIAMQPATVDGIADGAEGKPIDLVFNVTDSGGIKPYQVFSKINNYTGKRLKGYKIVVGMGVGGAFHSADQLGIDEKLFISLGIGEGMTNADVADGSNLFDAGDGLATFSHGLFGAPDTHFTDNGFFDNRTAGFAVEQICSANACTTYQPFAGITVPYSDTIRSTSALPSNYVQAPVNLGDWLPAELAPKGIFFDHDNDPTTDPVLQAWWNGTAWIKNFDSGFAVVTNSEIDTWAANPLYYVEIIEDVLNLGLNYIVKVGDDLDNNPVTTSSKITLRIIPVVGDQTQAHPWTTNAPASGDLLPSTVAPAASTSSSGGGGGCSLGGSGRFDPTLPAMLAAGLGSFGWRRFKADK